MSTRLPNVPGRDLTAKEWPDFTWNADLIEFEGPLVSLYKTSSDSDALFVWVDSGPRTNRWCVIEVDREPLTEYLNQKCTLRDLFDLRAGALLFNTGAAGRRTQLKEVAISDLPESYKPAVGSYLFDEVATDAARDLVREATVSYALGLDNDLYLEDITVIPRVVLQLYSFHYGLKYSTREAVRDKLQAIMEKWHGGINAVNIFTGLRSVIPSVHRPRVMRMQYASPGEIELNLLPSLIEEVSQSVNRISDDAVFKDMEMLYGNIYAFFKQEELSGFEDVTGRQPVVLTGGQSDNLQAFIDLFFAGMDWTTHKGNFDLLNPTTLSKLRALLAYYRRLRQLRPLLVQGKLTFP